MSFGAVDDDEFSTAMNAWREKIIVSGLGVTCSPDDDEDQDDVAIDKSQGIAAAGALGMQQRHLQPPHQRSPDIRRASHLLDSSSEGGSMTM
jgi:hypothetical protein